MYIYTYLYSSFRLKSRGGRIYASSFWAGPRTTTPRFHTHAWEHVFEPNMVQHEATPSRPHSSPNYKVWSGTPMPQSRSPLVPSDSRKIFYCKSRAEAPWCACGIVQLQMKIPGVGTRGQTSHMRLGMQKAAARCFHLQCHQQFSSRLKAHIASCWFHLDHPWSTLTWIAHPRMRVNSKLNLTARRRRRRWRISRRRCRMRRRWRMARGGGGGWGGGGAGWGGGRTAPRCQGWCLGILSESSSDSSSSINSVSSSSSSSSRGGCGGGGGFCGCFWDCFCGCFCCGCGCGGCGCGCGCCCCWWWLLLWLSLSLSLLLLLLLLLLLHATAEGNPCVRNGLIDQHVFLNLFLVSTFFQLPTSYRHAGFRIGMLGALLFHAGVFGIRSSKLGITWVSTIWTMCPRSTWCKRAVAQPAICYRLKMSGCIIQSLSIMSLMNLVCNQ